MSARNQPELTPSLTHSEPLEDLPNGGKRVAYTYTMAGIDLEGEIEAVAYEPRQYDEWEITGDLSGKIECAFESNGEATTVTYTDRDEVPVPVCRNPANV